MPKHGATVWLLVPAVLALAATCVPWSDGGAVPWLLGIAALVAWAAAVFAARQRKEPAPAPQGEGLALCATLRLSDRHRLHLVRFRSTLLLLGESGTGLQVLDAAAGCREELPTGAVDPGADLQDTPAPETGRAARRTVAEILDQAAPVIARSAVAAASLAEFKDRLQQARVSAENAEGPRALPHPAS